MNFRFRLSFLEGIIAALLFVMLAVLVVYYMYFSFQRFNWQGIKALQKEQPSLAIEHFSQSLEEQPLNPWIHLNLALSYDIFRNPLKALQIYELVSSQFSESPQFFALFNQGELYGRLNKKDKALESYQKALEFWVKEREIKQNIELLFLAQQNQNQNDQNNQNNSSSQNSNSQPQEDSQKNQNRGQQESQEFQKEKDNPQEEQQNQSENLSEAQEQAIFKAIEKQEGKVRSKSFKDDRRFQNKTKRDW